MNVLDARGVKCPDHGYIPHMCINNSMYKDMITHAEIGIDLLLQWPGFETDMKPLCSPLYFSLPVLSRIKAKGLKI